MHSFRPLALSAPTAGVRPGARPGAIRPVAGQQRSSSHRSPDSSPGSPPRPVAHLEIWPSPVHSLLAAAARRYPCRSSAAGSACDGRTRRRTPTPERRTVAGDACGNPSPSSSSSESAPILQPGSRAARPRWEPHAPPYTGSRTAAKGRALRDPKTPHERLRPPRGQRATAMPGRQTQARPDTGASSGRSA